MKRNLIILMFILYIFVIPATAQNINILPSNVLVNPINPFQKEVWEFDLWTNELLQNGTVDNLVFEKKELFDKEEKITVNGSGVTLTRIQEPELGGYGQWYISYPSDRSNIADVDFIIQMKEYPDSYSTIYVKQYDESNLTNYFTSCEIVSAGEYEVVVWVKYEDNSGYDFAANDTFVIADDDYHISLWEKVDQIVNECKARTKWQTALNLHDWLINNLYYDPNFEFFGADAILRGYGVCDAYSKAYLMLCKAANIPVGRVYGGGHAWNAIQINNQWYYVDPTWDDPFTGETDAVSGLEHHLYFCINEENLNLSHILENQDDNIGKCTSMDANYFYVTGEWKTFRFNWYPEDDTVEKTLRQNFEQGNETYTINEVIWGCGDYGCIVDKEAPINHILAYILAHEPLSLSDSSQVLLEVNNYVVTLKGWNMTETGTLKLPSNLTGLLDSSFYGIKATTAIISSGCKTIGPHAFENSNIRTVYIPDSVTSIDPSAFDNCRKIIFVTSNPIAKKYAVDYGMLLMDN